MKLEKKIRQKIKKDGRPHELLKTNFKKSQSLFYFFEK
jgi:hypothetical protein